MGIVCLPCASLEMLQVDTDMGILVQQWWLYCSSLNFQNAHWQNWHCPRFSEIAGPVQYRKRLFDTGAQWWWKYVDCFLKEKEGK